LVIEPRRKKLSDPHDPKDRFGVLQDPKRFQPYLENCFLMPEAQRSFALTLVA
jgi:hypothetical protein